MSNNLAKPSDPKLEEQLDAFCKDVRIGEYPLQYELSWDKERHGHLLTLRVGPDPWHISVVIREHEKEHMIEQYLYPMQKSLEKAVADAASYT